MGGGFSRAVGIADGELGQLRLVSYSENSLLLLIIFL